MSHHIEIRYAHLESLGRAHAELGWQRLTKVPLAASNIRAFVGLISEEYQWRVQAVTDHAGASAARSLVEIIETSPDLAKRVTSKTGSSEDTVHVLRSALFTVFENHGSAAPFTRWKPDRHELVHEKSCRRGKESWSTATITITAEGAKAGDYRWFVLQEMQRRARHLEEHTFPALKLQAACLVQPPRRHVGTCSVCNACSSASSVAIHIHWNGHVMQREYRL